MAYTGKTIEAVLQKIGDEAYNGWKGNTGEERRTSVLSVINRALCDFSKLTGINRFDILSAMEQARNVNCVNWYQEHKFPSIENVEVFQNFNEFKLKYPTGKFECPKCGGASTDPDACNVGDCNWKVYGLFGHLGKGIEVIIVDRFLEHPFADSIFKPLTK